MKKNNYLSVIFGMIININLSTATESVKSISVLENIPPKDNFFSTENVLTPSYSSNAEENAIKDLAKIREKVAKKRAYKQISLEKTKNFRPDQLPDDIAEMITQGVPMVTVLRKMVANKLIPLPRDIKETDLVIEDITNETYGRARQVIIKIGYVSYKPTEQPGHVITQDHKKETTWLYIFKETKDSKELKGIHAAYELHDRGILHQKEYRLKWAWHEKLWSMNVPNSYPEEKYFELLHIAKGKTIESLVDDFYFFDRESINTDDIIDLTNFKVLTDQENEELMERREKLFDAVKRETTNLPLNIKNSSNHIKKLQEFFDQHPHQLTANVQNLFDILNRYRVFDMGGSAIRFTQQGHVIYNHSAVNALKKAYKTFGSVLGKYAKQYQVNQHPIDEDGKNFSMPALDPHGNNIFYDEASKTITWIDLQKTGEYFLEGDQDNLKLLNYARHKVFGNFFYSGFRGQYFKNGVELFFPTRNSELEATLIEQRNQLFDDIKSVIEAFYDGFISNWSDPQDRQMLKDYFYKKNKFYYKQPTDVFDSSDPFVFK